MFYRDLTEILDVDNNVLQPIGEKVCSHLLQLTQQINTKLRITVFSTLLQLLAVILCLHEDYQKQDKRLITPDLPPGLFSVLPSCRKQKQYQKDDMVVNPSSQCHRKTQEEQGQAQSGEEVDDCQQAPIQQSSTASKNLSDQIMDHYESHKELKKNNILLKKEHSLPQQMQQRLSKYYTTMYNHIVSSFVLIPHINTI